jgi:hypothetical protein
LVRNKRGLVRKVNENRRILSKTVLGFVKGFVRVKDV